MNAVVKIVKEDSTLRDQIRAEMEAHNLSQSSVSKEAGVDQSGGASKFNQWLNDTYKGNNELLGQKIEKWLSTRQDQHHANQKVPEAPQWVETPTGLKIYNTLAYAQKSGVSSCIFGGAGVGKTSTCEKYQSTHNNVWIITASPAAHSYPATLRRIAKSIGLRGGSNLSSDLEDEIIERLKDTLGLLVIDEAQLLGNDALWGIKHLFDTAHIGVAYVGSEQVYSNLSGRKSEINAPLFRRISKIQGLKKPLKSDVKALLNAWDITDKSSIDYCYKIALNPGALGMVTETLRLASFIAGGKSEVTTFSLIKSAYEDLGSNSFKVT